MASSPIMTPGPRERTVFDPTGKVVDVPADWSFLRPGDAMVTRAVKAGPHWVVVEKRGRKSFTRGVWAPTKTIDRATANAAAKKATPEYARSLAAGRARREREQAEYVVDFTRSVLAFLGFDRRHEVLARELAKRVAEHATPVGSGTVARTERIPVAQRAEAAVIAWMRHQTTAYDRMSIPRVAGRRHEVRRMLAQRSRELLERYRRGEDIEPGCPLAKALASAPIVNAAVLEEDPFEDETEEGDDGDDDEVADDDDEVADDEEEDEDDDEVVVVAPKPLPRPIPKPLVKTTPLSDDDERMARQRAVRDKMAAAKKRSR